MGIEKIFVVESDVTDNAKTICNDSEFMGMTEVPIDVHLLYCLIGSGMSWHRTISCFVRIVETIKVMEFLKSFQLFDNAVGIFQVIFRNSYLNSGGIKDCHGSKSRIEFLTDWLSQINKVIEH